MRRFAAISLSLMLLSSQASALKFFYEHGIGANNTSFGFTPQNPGVCDGPSKMLCEALAGPNGGGVSWGNDYSNNQSDPSQMPSFTQTITAQAQNTLIPSISNRLAANEPFVLIGLSQGGLRARYAIENAPSLQSRAKALLTFDSPHAGAPIARNLPYFKGILASDLSFGTFGIFSLDQIVLSIVPRAGDAGQLLKLKGTEPGLQDLIPDSTFIKTLNGYSCHTETKYVPPEDPEPGMKGHYEVYQVCSRNASAPIPNTTSLISVWVEGTSPLDSNKKNTVEAALDAPSAQSLRANLADAANKANIAGWALIGTVLGIGPGLALRDAATRLWDFDNQWKTVVVGAQEGDGVVPKDSQLSMQSDTTLGGTRPFPAIQSSRWHSDTQNDPKAVNNVVAYMKLLQLTH